MDRNEARRARYLTDPAYRERERARVNAFAARHREAIRERNRLAYDARTYGDRIDAWRPSTGDSAPDSGPFSASDPDD